MFMFVAIGVLLSQTVVQDCYGQNQPSPDNSQPDIIIQPVSPLKNDSSDALILHVDGQYNIYASQLNLYSGGSLVVTVSTSFASNPDDREPGAVYVVTEGIGAHKLHTRELSWDQARKICVDEGGDLAVVRTDAEEKILLGMMMNNSVTRAWVSYLALTEKDDWFSVLGEPLGKIGWARWSSHWSPNPDINYGRCAELSAGGGLVNSACDEKSSFICKVSIDLLYQ